MTRTTSLALLLSALALCGMSSRYVIKVLQGNAHFVSFQFQGANGSGSNCVQVNTFLVVKQNEAGKYKRADHGWTLLLEELGELRASPIFLLAMSHLYN